MVATTVAHVIGPVPDYLHPLFLPQGIAGNDHTNKPSDKAAMWTYLPVFFRPAIMTDMVWSSPPSFLLQRTNNDNDDIVSSYYQTHVGPSTICLVVGGSKTTVRQAHVARRAIACLHLT